MAANYSKNKGDDSIKRCNKSTSLVYILLIFLGSLGVHIKRSNRKRG